MGICASCWAYLTAVEMAAVAAAVVVVVVVAVVAVVVVVRTRGCVYARRTARGMCSSACLAGPVLS
jgi:hypothetical protein